MRAVRPEDLLPAYVIERLEIIRQPTFLRRATIGAAIAVAALFSFVLGMWCLQQNMWAKAYFIKAETLVFGKDPTPQTVYKSKYDIWSDLPITQPVVMIGDSITEFGDWAELLDFDAIANRGVAKDTTEGVLNRLDRSAGSNGTVFLMIGLNDLSQGVKVETVITRYRKIVAQLNARGNRVYAQSILLTAGDTGLNKRISSANVAIQQLCREATACTYIDLNAAIAPNGELPKDRTIDGVHINTTGYRQWAAVIRGYLPTVTEKSA